MRIGEKLTEPMGEDQREKKESMEPGILIIPGYSPEMDRSMAMDEKKIEYSMISVLLLYQ